MIATDCAASLTDLGASATEVGASATEVGASATDIAPMGPTAGFFNDGTEATVGRHAW